MPSVPHLIILFIVVLVVFGSHKLPELARGLGKLMAEFRKASTDFRYAFEEEMRNIERQNREAEMKKAQAAARAPALPAPLGTPQESEPAQDAIDIEPVIRPNGDAVPRSEASPLESGVSDAPAEAPDSSLDGDNLEKPLHDQRPT
jgi:sec-independent protein translocase protein TatB